MKLSTRARYAVMAMADLAQQSRMDNMRAVSLAEISVRQHISLPYLEQIFNALRRAGLVRSLRGARGGYLLAAPPEATRIGDIISAVDKPLDMTRCRAGGGCMGGGRCLTHDLWDRLGQHIQGFLHDISLADLLARNLPEQPARAS